MGGFLIRGWDLILPGLALRIGFDPFSSHIFWLQLMFFSCLPVLAQTGISVLEFKRILKKIALKLGSFGDSHANFAQPA